MTKKIALFTLPLRNYNYGGILQNYALQQYLVNELGMEVETIDFRLQTQSGKRKIKMFIHQILYKKYYEFKNNVNIHLERFIMTQIKATPIFKTKSQITNYLKKEKFDLFITGSDQVWRLDYAASAYQILFLDFPEINTVKKMSYAASFGFDHWKFAERTQEIKKYLQDFDGVSVREDSGVKIAKETFDVQASHLPDPTLLLRKEDYVQLLSDKQTIKKSEIKTLYAYILDLDDSKIKVLNQISQQLHADLKIIELAENQLSKINNHNFSQYDQVLAEPMEDWLASFYHADYIITDSFHGTVFSIIFQKPFIALGNEKRGMSRFSSLLKSLGLEEHLSLDFGADKMSRILSKNIHYNEVEDKLSSLRTKTYQFFQKHL